MPRPSPSPVVPGSSPVPRRHASSAGAWPRRRPQLAPWGRLALLTGWLTLAACAGPSEPGPAAAPGDVVAPATDAAADAPAAAALPAGVAVEPAALPPGVDADGWRRGVFVVLVTAPTAGEVQGEALSAAMRGHFENMSRLADEGLLWVAGPLGEPRADPLHRGVFVLAADSVDAGLELASSDPGHRAGVFDLRAHGLATRAPLERLNDLDAARLAARLAASPDEEVAWEGRLFVLARGPRGPAADLLVAALETRRAALFTGHLGGDEWLVCLDAEDVTAARAQLVAAGAGKTAGRWTLMPWYASAALVDLPDTPR